MNEVTNPNAFQLKISNLTISVKYVIHPRAQSLIKRSSHLTEINEGITYKTGKTKFPMRCKQSLTLL